MKTRARSLLIIMIAFVEAAAAQDVNTILQKAAEGDAGAQGELGNMYYTGNGVRQDYKIAYDWYLKSAEQGVDFAQHALAYMYMYGQGVEMDNSRAIYWFRKSVAGGYKSSRVYLAILLYNGYAGGEAYHEAFLLIKELSNEMSNDDLWYKLASMYLEGKGVEINNDSAAFWMIKSAEKGNYNAQYDLSNMYYRGIGVAVDSVKGNYWRKQTEEEEYWYY